MQQYTLEDFQSIGEPDTWVCPSCGEKEYELYRAIGQHFRYCGDSDQHFLAAYFGERLKRAYQKGLSRNKLAEKVGVDEKTMSEALESLGVEQRDTTEAMVVWFQNLSEQKREAALHGGQDKASEVLSEWREKNMDIHRDNARKNLPAPRSGPENPCWRGGKTFRDKLVKIYGDTSWASIREDILEEYSHSCAMCGGQTPNGESLHIHHIVPILCGGSNHPDNLMPHCPSCHKSIEEYTKNEIGLEPVFIDE